MAKKSQIPMTSGGGVVSKLVGTAVIIAVVAFIVKHPVEAAHDTSVGFSALGDVVYSLMTFLQQLSG